MKPIPILAGPTASGKTQLSLHLAEKLPIEIISSDAMMVYTGMDIGTAKPTLAERTGVPHHLIDIRSPAENFSVQDWVLRAEDTIADIVARGRVPLVVGGTGFYVRALSQGLPTTPASDMSAISALQTELAMRGLDAMLGELAAAAPADAHRAERNPRRVLRSLEVLRATGKAPSQFENRPAKYRYKKIILMPARQQLEKNIALRAEQMIKAGLIEETRALMPIFLKDGRRPTSFQAIGYKQALDHLLGTTRPDGRHEDVTLEEATRRIALATRQYAKRQETWFKAEPNAIIVNFADQAEELLRQCIDEFLRS